MHTLLTDVQRESNPAIQTGHSPLSSRGMAEPGPDPAPSAAPRSALVARLLLGYGPDGAVPLSRAPGSKDQDHTMATVTRLSPQRLAGATGTVRRPANALPAGRATAWRLLLAVDTGARGAAIAARLSDHPPEDAARPILLPAGSCAEAEQAIPDPAGLDGVILDVRLPDFALPGLRRLLAHDAAPVLAVAGKGDRSEAQALLRAGVAAVITLDMPTAAWWSTLRLVRSGQRFAPPELLLPAIAKPTGAPGDAAISLSERERQVARLLAQGQSNKQIARRLDLQEVTIKVYASALYRKLGVTNRTAAATRLLALDLVQPAPAE